MSTDYGTDVMALDDLLDPEVLVSGDLNVAYALGRRLLTAPGAMAEIGDPIPYDSIDIRDWLGARFSLTDRRVLDDLQQQCRQVLSQDARVDTVNVEVSYTQGRLSVDIDGAGTNGPFAFVLAVDGVSATSLAVA